MTIHTNILDLVGNTPLVELTKIEKDEHLKARVATKIESFNPAGSAKDRIALNMIKSAEKEGKIKPGANRLPEIRGSVWRSYARKEAIS